MHDVDLILLWEIPSEHRFGLCAITDLIVGPRHGALQNLLAEARHDGGGRTMYAETNRERGTLLESIRTCDWNVDDDPIAVHVEGPRRVTHDFGNGPCAIPIEFLVHNYSLDLASRFTLRLQSPSTGRIRYIGNMTRHGLIPPSSRDIVCAKVLVLGPGLYEIPGWKLEVEVGKDRGKRWERFDQAVGARWVVEVSSSLEPQLI
ncbi:hypothetical protein BS47DRAFT_419311 [Hydnum rufescens UP504]|uniref:Uncharacterized protein n=1 Tax=Hydnum rufescens UP504 TaxID=1448309 RepID=A0A9P6B5L8_9AGAM|nr:hypothetical protein BS47DRAFT_419311 [Hydnum rufescens UP504]